MSAKETSITVDRKRAVSRAAFEMAHGFHTLIAVDCARHRLSPSEKEEAALGALAYAFARAIVMLGKSERDAIHLVREALKKIGPRR